MITLKTSSKISAICFVNPQIIATFATGITTPSIMQIRFSNEKRKMMKDKTILLIVDGYQVVLGVLALILLTIGIVAHAIAGHLGFVGYIIAGVMWYVMYSLVAMSVRDYKETKNSEKV